MRFLVPEMTNHILDYLESYGIENRNWRVLELFNNNVEGFKNILEN